MLQMTDGNSGMKMSMSGYVSLGVKTPSTHIVLLQSAVRYIQGALLSSVVIYYISAVCMLAGEQSLFSTTYLSVAAASSVADSTLHPLQQTLSTLHRLQAYDLNGVIAFGPASAAVAQQALTAELIALVSPRVLSTQSSATQFIRKCAVIQWQHLLVGATGVNDFLSSAGTTLAGLIILLPADWQQEKAEQVELFRQVELSLLQSAGSVAGGDINGGPMTSTVKIPMFFAVLDDGWQRLYSELPRPSSAGMESPASSRPPSAISTLAEQLLRNTYHLQTVGPQKKATEPVKTVGLLAKVYADSGVEQKPQRPIVLFVANYDTAGLAPSLQPQSMNSAGSGVAALMYVAELIQQVLKSIPKKNDAEAKDSPTAVSSLAEYEYWFMLSAFGKQHNFLGTKHWIEAVAAQKPASTGKAASPPVNPDQQFPPATRIHHAVCIDAVGTNENLFVHVSKPPKSGTPHKNIVDALRDEFVSDRKAEVADESSNVVHKKINLANDQLAWEHERFAVSGRVSALTVSQYAAWDDAARRCGLSDQYVEPLVISHNARRIVRATFRSILSHATTTSNNDEQQNAAEISATIDKLLDQLLPGDVIIRKTLHVLKTTQRSSQLIGTSSAPTAAAVSSQSRNKKLPVVADESGEMSPFIRQMHTILQPIASSLHVISDKLASSATAPEPQFYEPLTYDGIRVVRGKHAVFDVMLGCLAAGYVAILFAGMKFVLSQRAYTEPIAAALAKPFRMLFADSNASSTTKIDVSPNKSKSVSRERESAPASRLFPPMPIATGDKTPSPVNVNTSKTRTDNKSTNNGVTGNDVKVGRSTVTAVAGDKIKQQPAMVVKQRSSAATNKQRQ